MLDLKKAFHPTYSVSEYLAAFPGDCVNCCSRPWLLIMDCDKNVEACEGKMKDAKQQKKTTVAVYFIFFL